MAKYTEEQKTAVLARVSEIGVAAAAKEAGISVTTVSKWNKAAAVNEAQAIVVKADVKMEAAAKEAQAIVAKADKDYEAAEAAALTRVSDAEAENKAALKEARQDKADAIKIEVKKTKAKTSRKVKEKKANVKASVDRKINKAKAAKMDLVFESNGGMQIKPEEIVKKVPKGCDAAYVKLEENKIYWVKGEETGSVNIW